MFWPANGLLLGLLLRMPPRDRPVSLAACMLAAVAVNLGYSDSLAVAVTRAAVNILEVLCGYHLIVRFAPTFRLVDLRSLFILGAASMTAPSNFARNMVSPFGMGKTKNPPRTSRRVG